MPDAKTLLIAAGGTGGHITPGISIAEAWLAAGGKVVLATLTKNVSYPDIINLARNPDVAIIACDAPRMPRLNPLAWLKFFRQFWVAYRFVAGAARQENVNGVVGMGGYSSFPAVLFAILNRKPLFLCEQNARWGIVTRLGKFFARNIFLSFACKETLPSKFIVTGNPLRQMFTQAKKKIRAKAKKRIFFLGGSQGAQDINALYLAFLEYPAAKKYSVLASTGQTEFAAIKARSRKQDEIRAFIEDMPQAYLDADVVVARCGSGTLFEVLWAQKRAFLLPYPHAAANHQRANADAMLPQLDAQIFDERPFRVETALVQFVQFLDTPLKPQVSQANSRAELQIIRYIRENLP